MNHIASAQKKTRDKVFLKLMGQWKQMYAYEEALRALKRGMSSNSEDFNFAFESSRISNWIFKFHGTCMFKRIGGINVGNQGLKRYHTMLRMPRLKESGGFGKPLGLFWGIRC